MAILGRELTRRGHRVSVVGVADVEPQVRAEQLEFIALGTPSPELRTMIEQMGRLSALSSLRFVVQGACRLAEIICREAPAELQGAAADLLLVDQNEPAGGTVAEHMKIPFLSVAPSLPLNREPGIPPTFAPWSYSASPLAAIRNRLGYAISDRLIAPINQTLNPIRAAWGLSRLRIPDDSFSHLAQLFQMPREFDFPRCNLPPAAHYLGPFLEDRSLDRSTTSFPFEKLDGRPLIYASFGTLQSGAMTYFENIARACAAMNVQLVIAAGQAYRAGTRLPGDPIVVGYAPQMELLSRATLTITHAGLNTTMQSLSFGVPMVAIPMTHDQPAIAARIGWTGAGLVVLPSRASGEPLRQAIETVLTDSRHRAAAVRLRDAIRQAGGVGLAADIVEQYCGA